MIRIKQPKLQGFEEVDDDFDVNVVLNEKITLFNHFMNKVYDYGTQNHIHRASLTLNDPLKRIRKIIDDAISSQTSSDDDDESEPTTPSKHIVALEEI